MQENNLNLGQVIRVMSAEEAPKSSSLSHLSQVGPTNRIIEAVNTKEPSSAHYKRKKNPVSIGSQIIHLEEQNEHCGEVQNAEELREVEVMGIEAKEATEVENAAEVVPAAQKVARQEKVVKTYLRRRRKF